MVPVDSVRRLILNSLAPIMREHKIDPAALV